MSSYLEVTYEPSRSWCHALLSAIHNKPEFAAKHAAWDSVGLSDLAFAIQGRLLGLRETVRSLDHNLNALGDELERDPSAVNYVGSRYGYRFSIEGEEAIQRVLLLASSFVVQSRACFENLADFNAKFHEHYLDVRIGDKAAGYAAVANLLPGAQWIAAVRDARHDIAHTRYPWLAFEVMSTTPLKYEPVLMLNWRPGSFGQADCIKFQTLRDIQAGLNQAVEAVVQHLIGQVVLKK